MHPGAAQRRTCLVYVGMKGPRAADPTTTMFSAAANSASSCGATAAGMGIGVRPGSAIRSAVARRHVAANIAEVEVKS